MLALAHPKKRFQGQCIDGLITLLLFGTAIAIQQAFQLDGRVVDVCIIGIPSAYFLLADALPNGQSLGKRLLKVRVVDYDSLRPCSLLQSFLRNIMSAVFGILDAVLIFTQERKRAGDYLAKTVVIDCSHTTIFRGESSH